MNGWSHASFHRGSELLLCLHCVRQIQPFEMLTAHFIYRINCFANGGKRGCNCSDFSLFLILPKSQSRAGFPLSPRKRGRPRGPTLERVQVARPRRNVKVHDIFAGLRVRHLQRGTRDIPVTQKSKPTECGWIEMRYTSSACRTDASIKPLDL